MRKEPIDAVITWVDGSDKAYADKLALYSRYLGIHCHEASAPTRFNQCGEINYSVQSILRFAPWLRTIYILTDAQTPAILHQLADTPYAEKVKLVDHNDIFSGYEQYLPTFNSLTIESLLWRIQGLANNFIYLNDDCFIIKPVSETDFFRDNKIVLRGRWRVQTEKKWRHYLQKYVSLCWNKKATAERNVHRIVQENSAKLAGWHKHFFQLPHAPFPLQRTIFETFFKKNPDILAQNLHYPFRDHQQFWALSLAHHLEIKQNNVVFDNSLGVVTVNGAYHTCAKIQQRLAYADKKNNVAFACMQSIDGASEAMQAILFDWLERRIVGQ